MGSNRSRECRRVGRVTQRRSAPGWPGCCRWRNFKFKQSLTLRLTRKPFLVVKCEAQRHGRAPRPDPSLVLQVGGRSWQWQVPSQAPQAGLSRALSAQNQTRSFRVSLADGVNHASVMRDGYVTLNHHWRRFFRAVHSMNDAWSLFDHDPHMMIMGPP